MSGLERLSLNQATTKQWPLEDAVRGCVEFGIPAIGLWREHVQETGVERAARLVRDAGLSVSSLCRGGFFTAADQAGRARARDDNRLAVEEAATLGAEVLVLVCGGLPAGSRDLSGARELVLDGVRELSHYASERGVRLGVEPLHPMFCADRSVISTLGEALDLAEQFPADEVGVVVDTYHVWWDPQIWEQIMRAGPRITSFQVCDWVLPLPADVLLGRGHVGDGHIDIGRFVRAVDRAGYRGFVEVEIFNQDIWDTPGAETLRLVVERFRELE